MRRVKLTDRGGFSLLELLIVVAIMLVIAAYALPNVITTLSDYRLKNTMSQVGALYQQQRMQAVQANSIVTVPQDAATVNGRTVVYIDSNNNSQYDGNEPMVGFPNKISIVKSGAPAFASTLITFTPQSQSTYVVRFNSRGLPCVQTNSVCPTVDSSVNPPPKIGFLIYFKNDKSFGATGWGAITITPGGRIKTWVYNGSTYQSM